MIRLNNFIWSENEQYYPLEEAADGSDLYCKEVDFGSLPNNGTKTVAHNIDSLDPTKVHRLYLNILFSTSEFYADHDTWVPVTSITSTNVRVSTTQNATNYSGVFRVIYKK